jgi:hypothetical protein
MAGLPTPLSRGNVALWFTFENFLDRATWRLTKPDSLSTLETQKSPQLEFISDLYGRTSKKERRIGMEVYEVVGPVGKSFAESKSTAPRLNTLAGKTICEVSNSEGFRCEWSFPAIREVLQKRYPDARFVPYTEFITFDASILNPEKREKTRETLKAAYREKGCDAVISQFGG